VCATPDVAAGNPLVGSGSSCAMQLGLKFDFLICRLVPEAEEDRVRVN
jgi:hypothetical protein